MMTYDSADTAKSELRGILDARSVPRGGVRERIAARAVKRDQRMASKPFWHLVSEAELERIIAEETSH